MDLVKGAFTQQLLLDRPIGMLRNRRQDQRRHPDRAPDRLDRQVPQRRVQPLVRQRPGINE